MQAVCWPLELTCVCRQQTNYLKPDDQDKWRTVTTDSLRDHGNCLMVAISEQKVRLLKMPMLPASGRWKRVYVWSLRGCQCRPYVNTRKIISKCQPSKLSHLFCLESHSLNHSKFSDHMVNYFVFYDERKF